MSPPKPEEVSSTKRPNSPTENEKQEEPSSPKRTKVESPNYEGYDSDEWSDLEEEQRLFDEEWEKSEGFDVDFSKLTHRFGAGYLNLDASGLAIEPETNRDLMNRLCGMAIDYNQENTGIRLEFVKVLKANYIPSTGITLYMTFEAKDPSDGSSQPKLFQTVIRYLPRDIAVHSFRPKPDFPHPRVYASEAERVVGTLDMYLSMKKREVV